MAHVAWPDVEAWTSVDSVAKLSWLTFKVAFAFSPDKTYKSDAPPPPRAIVLIAVTVTGRDVALSTSIARPFEERIVMLRSVTPGVGARTVLQRTPAPELLRQTPSRRVAVWLA